MKESPAHDTLLILSPPVKLIDWIERVWAAKQAKGETIPPEFTRWLDRWRKIRQGLTTEIDVLTADEWKQIELIVHKTGGY